MNKNEFKITITKSTVVSNEPNFINTYEFLNGNPNKYFRPKIVEFYYTKDGKKIKRMPSHGEQKLAATSIMRLGIQIFESKLLELTDDELRSIKTDGCDAIGIIGFYRNKDEFENAFGNTKLKGSGKPMIRTDFINPYKDADGNEVLYFYSCGLYDSIIGVFSLLKQFDDDGEFVIKYSRSNLSIPIMIDDNFLTAPTNEIYYGVPGSGKSYAINEEVKPFEKADPNSVERVVFHPDYSYSDFVGQILPKIDDSGAVKYEFNPGPFTRIVVHAIENPDIPHYLVIEEINRGSAAAIFGDIFQLLDRDEDTKYSITNKDIADEIRKIDPDSEYLNGDKLVGLPLNLQLRATMNTSDQNVFTLDNAFQRRWDMKLVKNKIHPNHQFKDVEIHGVRWEQFHTIINSIIASQLKELGSAEDKLIGPYFVSEREILDDRLFAEKVLKYLWNDVFSFDKKDIFCDGLDTLEQVIDGFKISGFGGVFVTSILEKFEIPDTDNEQKVASQTVEIDASNDEENLEQ